MTAAVAAEVAVAVIKKELLKNRMCVCENTGAALVRNFKTMVFKIYYNTLFNISYTIKKFIYISYTIIMVYEKEAKKSCGI